DALATGPAAGSLRPSLGLLLGFGRTGFPWHWLLELHAAPHGQHEQRLAAGRLQLTRSDLTVRVGALWQRQRWGVLGFTEAGVLRVDASYRGNTARDERRSALLVGLGAEPNLQLTSWLRLFVSASLQAATPRGDYRVAGLSALREPALGLQLGAGMWLTLPIH
ncbi:MAG: hypothetical protein JWN48_4770, partial [Myxococcaceae bacterium]|nr:hypothetical protein [Myxococcaceae bacterium]